MRMISGGNRLGGAAHLTVIGHLKRDGNSSCLMLRYVLSFTILWRQSEMCLDAFSVFFFSFIIYPSCPHSLRHRLFCSCFPFKSSF